ncbi:methyltransferase domain-containing protein [Streptantibioticus rubrisoli]|uniref:Protein-L-isoaspartate O-methyltransferase n=1 Tax=Streptantibioticus rubrisoli TaxID=1387313 RepID=A0ABT1PC62_9ACTN|nr:methyltransferase domain-containing protein [Streptantibioticus rubrisoli]MCQ4042955.1 methyltransferase domain-containing protein [Streptantibioticus rubrisoli]
MSTQHEAEAGPERLASALIENGALTSDWLPAFQAVPRYLFVPDTIWPGRGGMNRQSDRVIRADDPELWWRAVYTDAPITTQWDDGAYTGPGKGQTPSSSNSMPTMVFSMLDALSVEPGNRVLEIGTGTGWNAALLSHRLGAENVVTVEVDEASARDARARLNAAGFDPLAVVGDGAKGYPEGAPYDRVIATCSIGSVPREWIEQTTPGGVIVAPWGPTYGGEAVVRLTVAGDGTASGPFVGSSAFMRLRAQRKDLPSTQAYLGGMEWPADGAKSMTTLSPDDVGDWIHMFAIGVQVPGLFCRVRWGADGAYRLWLHDTDVTSWATADYEKGRTRYEVMQSGRRNLWDELEAAWRWWDRQGQPGFERFGLTVSGQGHTIWLDSPRNRVPTFPR